MKRRVLVVEDDPTIRMLIVESLRDRGLDVLAAVDGRHALRTAIAVAPALVVLDLGLPDRDGAAFIDEWRSRQPSAKDVPIVVVSGLKEAQRVAAAIGARRVFGKPFIVDDLAQEVSRALN